MLADVRLAPQVIDYDEGRMEIWTPRPGLVLTRAEGHMLIEHALAMVQAVDAAIAARPGAAIAVHDWTEVTGYQVAVQARMMGWSVSQMKGMKRVMIGVVSPFVALAVRTVNLASGNRFEVVDSRDEIERTVAALLS